MVIYLFQIILIIIAVEVISILYFIFPKIKKKEDNFAYQNLKQKWQIYSRKKVYLIIFIIAAVFFISKFIQGGMFQQTEKPFLTGKPLLASIIPNYFATATVIHQSQYSVWDIFDNSRYTGNTKANIDLTMSLFDQAVPTVIQDLGRNVPLPVRVHIEDGDCCGGWAGGGEVGFSIGDFSDSAMCQSPETFTAMDWTKGVIIGEFVNYATGEGVSGGWPRDWWVDDVWYFPATVVVQVLDELGQSSFARHWELGSVGCPEKDYMSMPIYVAFKNLKLNYGWDAYQTAFSSAKQDQMNWDLIGSQPSALRTNYILAYLTMGANTNVASQFQNAGVNGANPSVVQQIVDARNLIYSSAAQGKDVTAAWNAYRNGNYMGVQNLIKDSTSTVLTTTTASSTTTAASSTTTSTAISTTTASPTTSTAMLSDNCCCKIGNGQGCISRSSCQYVGTCISDCPCTATTATSSAISSTSIVTSTITATTQQMSEPVIDLEIDTKTLAAGVVAVIIPIFTLIVSKLI
jgi:hypothetical protein